MTEIPRAEVPRPKVSQQSYEPQTSDSADPYQEPVIPEQIDWNRRSLEIARTELSPLTRDIQQRAQQITQPEQRQTPSTSESLGEQSAVTALNPSTSIQAIDETPLSKPVETKPQIVDMPSTTAPLVVEPESSTEPAPINPVAAASAKLAQNEPELAILTINAIDPKSLSKPQRAEVLQLKGQAYRQLNMSIAALRFDAERLRYLEDNELKDLSQRILTELNELPERLLQDLSVGTDILAGLAHALTLKNDPSDEGIAQWLRKYRSHPLLKANLEDYEFLSAIEPPNDFSITVLLPLSGDLGNAGRAIRDGMLFEYQKHRSEFGVALKVIDSSQLSSDELIAIGQSAESEFIIGPLQKEKVVELIESKPRVPLLALNRVKTDDVELASPVYSLSLAIEDDAESTVNQIARDSDRPRVVVLHSDSPLGLRAAKAIEEQVKQIGGSSAGQFPLDAEKPETVISQAFGVDDSKNRRRQLSKALGLRLEQTPRIRQDMSAVVVHAGPMKAQQIRPLLDFYYLDQTPVYLIGAYRPDLNEVAEDLRNSQLMVTPWDLGTEEKQSLTERTNAQGVFGSLVGVGIDAMRMAMQLGFGGSTSFQGQTGYLSLGADSLIHRQLSTIEISNNQQITAQLWEPLPSILQPDLSDAE